MTLVGILLAIFAFGVLVLIHELGHFIAAKRAGVKVNEFSIGMGPALFKTIKGDTQYSLRLFPIGGFVALEGEESESDDSRSFGEASLPRRAIIMAAGAIMNLVLGFVLMGVLTFYQTGQEGALLPTPQIAKFYDTAVTNTWLQEGDTITAINGKKIKTYNDLSYRLLRDSDGIIDITVNRAGETVTLDSVEFKTESAEGMQFIVLDFMVKGIEPTFFNKLGFTWDRTKFMTKQIWSGFSDLVTGRIGFNQLSGPIGITKQMSEQTSSGDWQSTLLFVSMLSLNLGIFNLLPFPALDGGRLLFLLIEWIRKKPVNQKYEVAINFVGIMLLLGLMVAVTFKDVISLFR